MNFHNFNKIYLLIQQARWQPFSTEITEGQNSGCVVRNLRAGAQSRKWSVLHHTVSLFLGQRSTAPTVAFVVIDNVNVGWGYGARVFEIVVLGFVPAHEHRVGTEPRERGAYPYTPPTHPHFSFDNIRPLFRCRLAVIQSEGA